MTLLKQTLRLEHKLDNGDVISSEIEFDFEDYDNYVEPLNCARRRLLDAISNGRPGVIGKCRHSMGMEYSLQQFNYDEMRYIELRKNIENLKKDIRIKQEDFDFLLSIKNRLENFDKVIKEFDSYREFLALLRAFIQMGGMENSGEIVEKSFYLEPPIVSSSEEEAEDKNHQEEIITD